MGGMARFIVKWGPLLASCAVEQVWIDHARIDGIVSDLRRTMVDNIFVDCSEMPEEGGCRANCLEECAFAPEDNDGQELFRLYANQSHQNYLLDKFSHCLLATRNECTVPWFVRLRSQHSGKRCVRLACGLQTASGWLVNLVARELYTDESAVMSLVFEGPPDIFTSDFCKGHQLVYDIGLGGDDVNCRIPWAGLTASKRIYGERLVSQNGVKVDISHLSRRFSSKPVVTTIRPNALCVFDLVNLWEMYEGPMSIPGAVNSRFVPEDTGAMSLFLMPWSVSLLLVAAF